MTWTSIDFVDNSLPAWKLRERQSLVKRYRRWSGGAMGGVRTNRAAAVLAMAEVGDPWLGCITRHSIRGGEMKP